MREPRSPHPPPPSSCGGQCLPWKLQSGSKPVMNYCHAASITVQIPNNLCMTLNSSKLAILASAPPPPLPPARRDVLDHPGAELHPLLLVLHHQRLQLHVLQSLHLCEYFVGGLSSILSLILWILHKNCIRKPFESWAMY